MKPLKTTFTVTAALFLAAVAFGFSSGPSTAAEIGTGRALVRIDAKQASVEKRAFGSYTLTIPTGSAGQWMGERTDAQGVERLRVGNLSAKQLRAKWRAFKYTSFGVKATLAWRSGGDTVFRLVRVNRPRVTNAGITFQVMSDYGLPSTLKKVSVNLERAPRPTRQTTYESAGRVTITGSLEYWGGIYGMNSEADAQVQNNGSQCWGHTFTAIGQSWEFPQGSCGSVYTTLTGGFKYMPAQCPGCLPPDVTQVYVTGQVQPSGEDAFGVNAVAVYHSGM